MVLGSVQSAAHLAFPLPPACAKERATRGLVLRAGGIFRLEDGMRVYLVVELGPDAAMEAAKLRGIRAVVARPGVDSSVLAASMVDYERILEWYCSSGTQLRRTFGAER